MYKKLLILLILVFLSFNVFAQNNVESQPIIHSLLATPNTIDSGEYVSFSIIATDPNDETLTFEWDFGDGSFFSGLNPKHVFVLEEGKTSQEFTVKITVSNESGLTTSKTTKVRVNQADLIINILDPSESTELKKTEKLNLRLQLLDRSGEIVPAENVLSIEAKISEQGNFVELRKSTNNEFIAEMNINKLVEDVEYLFVNATAIINGKVVNTKTLKLLQFKKPEINAEITTVPNELFPNSKLDVVRVKLLYNNGNIVQNARIVATLNNKLLEFEEGGDFYEAKNLKHIVKGPITITIVEAKDNSGNSLKNFTKVLNVLESDSDFQIEFELPKQNTKVSPGQKIKFIVKVKSPNIDLSQTSMELLGNNGLKIKEFSLNQQTKNFEADYVIPINFDSGKELNFKVKAETILNGEVKKSNNSINLLVSNQFVLKVISATDQQIKVDLFYPGEEKRVDTQSFDATLEINSNKFSLKFSKQADGSYIAPINFELPEGEQQIKLSLGAKYGFAEQTQSINVQPSLLKNILFFGIIALILIVIIIVGFVIVTKMKKQPVKEEHEPSIWSERKEASKKATEGLSESYQKTFTPVEKEEPETLISSKEDLKNLIQRQITYLEKIIPKRIMSEEEKLKNLQELIREKSLKEKITEKSIEDIQKTEKLYEGLSRQEIIEVETLVQVLAPYKEKYSPSDIESAAITEGTSPKLAKIVVKKLFK